jgi:Protein of unknown function (DUF3684)
MSLVSNIFLSSMMSFTCALVWNQELLYVGGFLARTAYEVELDTIRELWKGASSSLSGAEPELQEWSEKRSLHALRFFTFHASTPSSDVSNLLEAAFFSCRTDQSFSIISTAGVRNSSEVRLPDVTFSAFLKQLPVLPEEALTDAPLMISSLQNRGMIKAFTFADVLNELRSRPFTEEEMVACLKWWIGLNNRGENSTDPGFRAELLNAASLLIGTAGGADERILPLASVRTFINPKNLIAHLDGPLPNHVLPLSVTKTLPSDSLAQCFPWAELSIVDWLQHLTEVAVRAADAEHDINRSAPWAERVLTTLARSWPSLSNGTKDQLVALLKNQACIPTSAGMKLPEQAYFANANIFNDLPVVTLPSGVLVKGPMERLLQALGVRKHVEIQIVFDRCVQCTVTSHD